jgi:hypothetical protein
LFLFIHTLIFLQQNATTCLADLCPIFGCGPDDALYSKNGKKKKKWEVDAEIVGFGGIVTCTESEVEKIRYRCEVLNRRCFGSMQSIDGEKNVAAIYFNDNICRALHCENGIMKGVMVDTDDDFNSPTILATVVRWMLCIGIFMSIVLYGKCN